jgi:hypothetical protein
MPTTKIHNASSPNPIDTATSSAFSPVSAARGENMSSPPIATPDHAISSGIVPVRKAAMLMQTRKSPMNTPAMNRTVR